jgi:hypothetical protein
MTRLLPLLLPSKHSIRYPVRPVPHQELLGGKDIQ